MNYSLYRRSSFKRDYRRCIKRGYDVELIHEAFRQLSQNGTLPKKYHAHQLKGTYTHFWECHIQPDWLLIYSIDHASKKIFLTRTGTHSDLFSE